MVRCEINVTGGLSSAAKIGCAKLVLPQGQELVDMQFIDDSLLMMILWDKSNFAHRSPICWGSFCLHFTGTGRGEMMSMAYTKLLFHEGFDLSNSPLSLSMFVAEVHPDDMVPVSRKTFAPGWVPRQLALNGQPGRRVGMVVAQDGVSYCIFDLDHDDDEEEEEDGEDEGEDRSDQGGEEQRGADEGGMEVDEAEEGSQ